MLTTTGAFTGFSVSDPERARDFYGRVLGLDIVDGGMGGISQLTLPGGATVILYPKENHEPATYTVLNLEVPDVAAAIRELADEGLEPLRYDAMPQDADGAMRGHGPDIAWFEDPFGNVFSVIAD